MEPCLLGVVTRNPMLAGLMVQDLSDIHRKNKLKTLQISVSCFEFIEIPQKGKNSSARHKQRLSKQASNDSQSQI